MLSGGTFLSPKPIELIDTLWNVNEDDPDDDPEDDPELIDTLWNVKDRT